MYLTTASSHRPCCAATTANSAFGHNWPGEHRSSRGWRLVSKLEAAVVASPTASNEAKPKPRSTEFGAARCLPVATCRAGSIWNSPIVACAQLRSLPAASISNMPAVSPLRTPPFHIAHAHGERGPCREYLSNTLEHLRQMGVRDRGMERLLELVQRAAKR